MNDSTDDKQITLEITENQANEIHSQLERLAGFDERDRNLSEEEIEEVIDQIREQVE